MMTSSYARPSVKFCQKAPSAIRCIKTSENISGWPSRIYAGQKAPSAIRCIKTKQLSNPSGIQFATVRKHLAP